MDAWFDHCSVKAPGNANKGLALMRQIIDHAVEDGLFDVTPPD